MFRKMGDILKQYVIARSVSDKAIPVVYEIATPPARNNRMKKQ